MFKKKFKTKSKLLKTYFIILNLVFATIAFSYLIGSVDGSAACPSCSSTPVKTGSGTTLGAPTGADIAKQQLESSNTAQQAAATVQPSTGARGGGEVAGATAPTYGGGEVGAAGTGAGGGITGYFDNFLGNLGQIGMGMGIGATIGALAGGKNGAMWGTIAGAAGVFAYQMAKQFGLSGTMSAAIGIGVFLLIFILTYKKESKKPIEFQCLPWQAPIGGKDCEVCNNYAECSQYTCKSLGQACDLVNIGQKNQKCIWKNQYDTNSPIISMVSVTKGHKYIPFKSMRPVSTGVEIKSDSGKCIKAFTPLSFTFTTKDSESGLGEPSQCKIDYNLTTYSADAKTGLYDNMGYYVGGDNSFEYNHTETLSLPGPDAVNAAIEAANLSGIKIMNDGNYVLYIRCQDANGNFNVDPYAVKFCVEPGPDTTPPVIVNVSIPSNNPIQFNKTSLDIEVYVNEPADCKWSHEDGRKYDLMEYNMSCANDMWEMNNMETYTCKTKLTGIESRKDNVFYFRCLDQPYMDKENRNPNMQSYEYHVIGTQPLNILEILPSSETISGATDVINVTLFVETDNGYNSGEALCYYSTTGNEKDYIEFSNTGSNLHAQRQDLVSGDYTYYVKCVDLGGNAAYNSTHFTVKSDKDTPFIARAYKESGELKIITDENAECSYSFANCNFEIDDGVKMSSVDYINHNTEWKSSKNFYIRCKDKYNNQPNPNTCSIILRPWDLLSESSEDLTIEL